MKSAAVIETLLNELEEVGHRTWSNVWKQLYGYIPFVGFYYCFRGEVEFT